MYKNMHHGYFVSIRFTTVGNMWVQIYWLIHNSLMNIIRPGTIFLFYLPRLHWYLQRAYVTMERWERETRVGDHRSHVWSTKSDVHATEHISAQDK